MELHALLDAVRDDERSFALRLRALVALERARLDVRGEVARELVPALHAPPDVASRVHLALLVLAPELHVGRDDGGRFVASALSTAELVHDGVGVAVADPAIGRVVPLDALAQLFGPDDVVPAFLQSPARGGPAPYRPPTEVLERRRIEEELARSRSERRERLRELGLEESDLDDDAPMPRASWVERFRALTVATLVDGDSLVIATGGRVVDVGRAHPGEWWSDERAGDHRGARRWHVRLDRPARSDKSVVRREKPLHVRDAIVEVSAGEARLSKHIDGRGVVAFVEEEDGLVVAVALTWSSWDAFRVESRTAKKGPLPTPR